MCHITIETRYDGIPSMIMVASQQVRTNGQYQSYMEIQPASSPQRMTRLWRVRRQPRQICITTPLVQAQQQRMFDANNNLTSEFALARGQSPKGSGIE